MNVYLSESADQLPGDVVQRWVLRSDLAPVPRTLEMTVKVTGDLQERLKVGANLWTGREMLKYEIVKVDRADPSGVVQGTEQRQAFTITALLASFAQIAYRRATAVIAEDRTLGELFRACGSTAPISTDIAVARFACMRGQVPSFQLAIAMQEASAAIVLREKKFSAFRLTDLFNGKPIDAVGQADTSARIESEFLERHEVPAYFSTAQDNQFVMGAFESARTGVYWPRADENTLRNMSRVLVLRKIVPSAMCQEVIAGDVMSVEGENLVVMTAAHCFEQRDGITDTKSRLWLGAMAA
ncbi:hypothetical protein [Stutzerimonas nitrititolerans]|uniref:hypothetical protein n=1 Tax=Stutzerimonas nitrititolerans TaxID=2482751 RepID=UPI0028A9956B|nr:hypothetical protein [Stutzerimonas nitrititolerans]